MKAKAPARIVVKRETYQIIVSENAQPVGGDPLAFLPEHDLVRHLHPPLANPEPLPSTSYRPQKKKAGKKSISSPPPRGSSRKKS